MSDPSREDLEHLLEQTDDPSVILPLCQMAVGSGQMSREQAFARAGAPALARATTAESINKLIDLLSRWEPGAEQGLVLLAGLVERHASAMDDLGRSREALPLYDAVVPILSRHLQPAAVAIVCINRAIVLWHCGQHREAVAGYDQALPVLREHAPPASYARCLMNRAIALRALGQHREAVAGYADARRALRRARQLGRMDETSLKFGDEWARLYRFSVDTALAAGHPDQAHEAVCNGKAGLIGDLWLRQHEWAIDEPAEVGETRFDLTDWMRNCVPVLEQGKSTPLPSEIVHYQMQVQNYLTGRDERTRTSITTWGQAHHAYSADRPLPQDKETTLADIQGCLPADWALIDFWRTANEEFTAFALFRDRLHVQKLPFPYERLKEQLDLFVATLRSNNRDDADLGMLNELYTYLFLLLRRMLKEHDIQGLYLVPHDFLHLLPLHAARIGEPPVYLCDEYAIAYLPTASLLPRLPELSLDGSAFIVANPEVGTEATLPFSHWEGLQLHKRFSSGDTCCHLGKAGTFAATGDWSQAGLVHFTCHGMGDDRFSPRSHLRLADDLLLAHDVLYRRPPLQKGAMVVLNGCETSVPDMRSINESLGLMSAFLVKGAGLVLSTQWSVADSCAAGMVLTFVDQVRAGARPAEALKTAQKEVRKLKAPAILARTDEVARLFPKGSHEHAKLQVNRAWVCLRAGMIDEARQAAEEARVPLRNLGLMREAQSLYRTLDETRSPGFKPVKARLESFDSPVYWGAFQLVGRVV